MKAFRITLITAAILLVLLVSVGLFGPAWTAFSTRRHASAITRIVPKDLQDFSVSQSPGQTLSYFGYSFEVPWTDLDESKTKISNDLAILTFHSGVRMMVGAESADFWINNMASNFHSTPKAICAFFGLKSGASDYSFLKAVYEFSPDQIKPWTFSEKENYRSIMILVFKSAILSNQADSGIFNLRSVNFEGFQVGDPTKRSTTNVEMFSDQGNFTFTVFQKDYTNSKGVTQAEINRIAQSFRRITANARKTN